MMPNTSRRRSLASCRVVSELSRGSRSGATSASVSTGSNGISRGTEHTPALTISRNMIDIVIESEGRDNENGAEMTRPTEHYRAAASQARTAIQKSAD